MKIFNKFKIIFFCILLNSCAYNTNQETKVYKEKIFYSSKGFALVYEETLYKEKIVSKKLPENKFVVLHSRLKRNTPIKITNPANGITVDATILKNANYPKIFNLVINSETASALKLNLNEPYIEFNESKKNKTFVAKEGDMFEEERNVLDKAPVSDVLMDDLSKEVKEKKKKSHINTNYILVVSDFYYLDSANNLRDDLIKKTNINDFYIKKINNNKFRLFAGPFKNFNSLKSTYISLNDLGFEELNVYKENK